MVWGNCYNHVPSKPIEQRGRIKGKGFRRLGVDSLGSFWPGTYYLTKEPHRGHLPTSSEKKGGGAAENNDRKSSFL